MLPLTSLAAAVSRAAAAASPTSAVAASRLATGAPPVGGCHAGPAAARVTKSNGSSAACAGPGLPTAAGVELRRRDAARAAAWLQDWPAETPAAGAERSAGAGMRGGAPDGWCRSGLRLCCAAAARLAASSASARSACDRHAGCARGAATTGLPGVATCGQPEEKHVAILAMFDFLHDTVISAIKIYAVGTMGLLPTVATCSPVEKNAFAIECSIVPCLTLRFILWSRC